MLSALESFASDLRYAVRSFHRSPAFASLAILTLAIGIGASTAVFSVVDLLLFRSLPYPRAEQLVSFGFSGPIDNNEFHLGGAYLDWRARQTAFQSFTSMYPGGECEEVGGEAPERVHCQQVEANFLRTLGIAPQLGRDFRPADDLPGAPRVALLGHAFWQSHFGGDPAAVGKTIQVDGATVRVAGVLPATFEMPQLGPVDVMLPQQMDPRAAHAPNSTIFLRAFGRLKDGVTIEAARKSLLPLFQESLNKDVPPMLRREVKLVVRGLRDRQIRDSRTASWLMFGAVLALLALACANVTNLLLARAAARRGEFAVRAALGAGRGRMLRQMLAESLVLSLAGCAAGCAFAGLLLRAFIAIAPDGIIRLNQARLDPRVLTFALGGSVLAAVAAGLLPAWERLSIDALAGWRTAGSLRMRSRQVLVAAQIALSLVLLSGASLLVRSLWNLESESLGFEPRHVVTASFTLSRQRYRTTKEQDSVYAVLERQLASIPGVTRFALTDTMPPAGGAHGRPFSNIKILGRPPLPQNGGMVTFRYVTPGYFATLGIPMLAGRDFDERERAAADTAVVLSATLARRMFGAENAVGQQIDLESDGHWLPIVGVAADVKNSGLAEAAAPEYYRVRSYQSPELGLSAVALLESAFDEATAVRWIRKQVAAVDPALPVKTETMQHRVTALTGRPRFLAALLGLFAAFGLALAAIGLYGVLSFLVAQRAREIGVRMAMGATPANIAGMVERQAGVWVLSGLAAGFAAAIALARIARSALFEVSPYDGASLAAAVGLLAVVAALAAWRPARKAARVDPAVSLRVE